MASKMALLRGNYSRSNTGAESLAEVAEAGVVDELVAHLMTEEKLPRVKALLLAKHIQTLFPSE